jgi:hypothetical protein
MLWFTPATSRVKTRVPPTTRTTAQIRSKGRNQHRQRLQRDAWAIIIAPDLPRQKIITRNASPNGIGFHTEKLLNVGDRFALRLRTDDETGGLYLCRVTHCNPGINGAFEGGAQFEASVPNPTADIPADWLRRATQ